MKEENQFICQTSDLDDPGSRGFSFKTSTGRQEGFVVKTDGSYFAYLNECPHTGSELDWVEHQFLNADFCYIQCAVHDACFKIDSGECVTGPCVGDKLKAIEIIVRENSIFLV